MKPLSASFTIPGSRSKWSVWALFGTRTQSGLDTLKNIFPAPGFVQILPPHAVASLDHVAWACFSVVNSLHSPLLSPSAPSSPSASPSSSPPSSRSSSPRFSNPALALLCYMAGVSQWEEAKRLVGVRARDTEVLLVACGPSSLLSSSTFTSRVTEWGLTPSSPQWSVVASIPPAWSRGAESWHIEQSALMETR